MNEDDAERDNELRVRVNEALRRQIETAAKRSLRSMNSEIIYRLRGSFEQEATAS